MSPKVSVVIPAFNRPAAVCRAIQSVLTQTFQDFEIIVVDDASTDTTAASVAAFTDPRIRLICHERNRGGSAARNTGIRASSALYVAFLDSDDEWLPTKLERQLALFERSSERLALVYTGAQWLWPDDSVTYHIPRGDTALSSLLLTENVIGETSLGMVRRSALDAIGDFDESLPSCQDMDLWLRICGRFQAAFVPEALVRVMKGNDGGRISSNIGRATSGRAMFCEKHREKLIREGVLHLYLRKSGWWEHRRVRDSRLARRTYLESLRANPFAPLTYVLLTATYVPMACLDMIARYKQLIARFLGLGPEAYLPENSHRLTSEANLHRNASEDSATL